MRQKINFIETSLIKKGVTCDIYEFENDTTKDVGIVKVLKGCETPLQKVLSGDRTFERFSKGIGTLTVISTDGQEHIYSFPGKQQEVQVKIGETMQWKATEDLEFLEICHPPYQEGRFQNISEANEQ